MTVSIDTPPLSKKNSKTMSNPSELEGMDDDGRAKPDYAYESQGTAMRIGTFFAYLYLVSYALTYSFFWTILQFFRSKKDPLAEPNKGPGYSKILKGFGAFYQRIMFALVNDCWSRPIASAPGVWIDVVHRVGSHKLDLDLKTTGEKTRCLNLGSYNYLGFAVSAEGEAEESMIEVNKQVSQKVADSIANYGVAMGSPAGEVGQTDKHRECEKLAAKFVGKEDALIFGMGYNTNFSNIPLLMGEGSLIVSDGLNHASLVAGCKASGAVIKVFRHNDLGELEDVLRKAIRTGQGNSKQYKPWTKILIIVEGIYSMEGEILRLPEIIAIKKKYKAYLYVDEAHSIGCLGARGRGVCDYWGVDPADVDILMGTFTKSFASVGGYIASNKELISALRSTSLGMVYGTSMPVPCVEQILCALRVITGEDGSNNGVERIRRLRENSIYFRKKLRSAGFILLGDYDSPVVPMMTYNPFKFCDLSRELLERNVAIVVVGYPATPLLLGRARFCMSSTLTLDQLDRACNEIIRLGKAKHLDYLNHTNPWHVFKAI